MYQKPAICTCGGKARRGGVGRGDTPRTRQDGGLRILTMVAAFFEVNSESCLYPLLETKAIAS